MPIMRLLLAPAVRSASAAAHVRSPMPRLPDVSVIVTTYQRPHSLVRVLTSLAVQKFTGSMEVVVADDGSVDQTESVVRRFSETAPFDLQFITHRHDGFQLARCRNEGVRASRASYLIILDGDCIAPPSHVANHLRLRRPGAVIAGTACYLDPTASERLDEAAVLEGHWRSWASGRMLRDVRRAGRKARFYSTIAHSTKPRLRGGNFGVWRDDYLRVNGFDENFRGWGCEDDDMGMRLRRAGCSIRPALHRIPTFHLWHPVEPSFPQRWKDGENVDYLHRAIRWTRCIHGVEKRDLQEITYVVRGARKQDPRIGRWLAPAVECAQETGQRVDIEVVVAPGRAGFSGRADCRVLIVPGTSCPVARAVCQADVILADRPIPHGPRTEQLPLHAFHIFLQSSTENHAGTCRRQSA